MKKLTKAELDKRVAEYRKMYPKNTLYYTEDGNVFLHKNAATDHARKTKQKLGESEVKAEKEQTKENKLTKANAEKQLKKLELTEVVADDVLNDLVEALDLKPASDKKDDLLAALDEYKKTLK